MATREYDAQPLLEAVLRGDRRAWERFYLRYNPRIERWIGTMLRSYGIAVTGEDIADHAAELWSTLLRDQLAHLRRFDAAKGCSVSGWLRLLAQRCTIDQLRARGGKQRRREQGVEMDVTFTSEGTPDSALEREEQVRMASSALKKLKTGDQRFLQCYLEASRPAHLASNLGISVGAVHSRQFKIRNKLRHLIQAEQQRAEFRETAYHQATP